MKKIGPYKNAERRSGLYRKMRGMREVIGDELNNEYLARMKKRKRKKIFWKRYSARLSFATALRIKSRALTKAEIAGLKADATTARKNKSRRVSRRHAILCATTAS